MSIVDGSLYNQNPSGLQQYIQELIREPFNLSWDYMLRASLIKLHDEEHVLVVIMHHIASDGWSTFIIVKEVGELYAAYVENRRANLTSLPIQYAGYALWQRNYLQGEILDGKIEFWKDKLHDVVQLQLPTDYTKPAVRSNRGASIEFNIDKELFINCSY